MKKHIDDFIGFIRAEKGLSAQTAKSYRKDIEQYVKFNNVKNLEEITKANIRVFLADLADKGISARTRSRKLSSLRVFLGYLSSEEVIVKNPTDGISFPKQPQRLPKIETIEHVGSLIDAVTNLRDRAIMELLYGAGMRAQELVNIKLDDVDFDNTNIKVLGKGDKERIIPINNASIDAIKEYIRHYDLSGEYLFPSPRKPNSPISTRAIQNLVSKYTHSSMHPHMFRHSCATHMHMNGADIREIQEFLGHANINSTTIYTSVANQQLTRTYRRTHPRT